MHLDGHGKGIMEVSQRLIASLKDRGVNATIRAVTKRLDREIRIFADKRFDRRFGVDTRGIMDKEHLDISAAQKRGALHYEPTPVPAIQYMLKLLHLDYSEYTFIDYGSGKGRVLLLASVYPYKKIIGIEHSPLLHRSAVANIRKWRNAEQKCSDIESLCMDARDFMLPWGPLVLFFFSPFSPEVAGELFHKLQISLDDKLRPVHIFYYGGNPCFIEQLMNLGLSGYEIYSRRPFSAMDKYTGLLFSSDADTISGRSHYARLDMKKITCRKENCDFRVRLNMSHKRAP